jgi:hypothetical protein
VAITALVPHPVACAAADPQTGAEVEQGDSGSGSGTVAQTDRAGRALLSDQLRSAASAVRASAAITRIAPTGTIQINALGSPSG